MFAKFEQYPGVPGRADYCVYWFRRSRRIASKWACWPRRNQYDTTEFFSPRRTGLHDPTDGTITDAVSTQVWSGEASVYVSIVNWIKGYQPGSKVLRQQLGDNTDSPWQLLELDSINSSLSATKDISSSRLLKSSANPRACFQGQTHGNSGFLLTFAEAAKLRQDIDSAEIAHPYMIGDDLLGSFPPQPSRFAIDLNHCQDLISAMSYGKAFERVEDPSCRPL